jgi:hypothetical protein
MECLLLIFLDGSWGDWSGWSVCSQSCGDLLLISLDGIGETSLLLISLDGSWGDWSGWSVCC